MYIEVVFVRMHVHCCICTRGSVGGSYLVGESCKGKRCISVRLTSIACDSLRRHMHVQMAFDIPVKFRTRELLPRFVREIHESMGAFKTTHPCKYVYVEF